MKKKIIRRLLPSLTILSPVYLLAWDSMYIKGEFNSWSDQVMLESIDHDQHWFWPYKASSTDAQMATSGRLL